MVRLHIVKHLIYSLLEDQFVFKTSGSLLQVALGLKQVQFSNENSTPKANVMPTWKHFQTGEFKSSEASAEMEACPSLH